MSVFETKDGFQPSQVFSLFLKLILESIEAKLLVQPSLCNTAVHPTVQEQLDVL